MQNTTSEPQEPSLTADCEAKEKVSLENEPFYFESDTLALRNNADYSCLMKTLILLQAQRVKACNDLEKLIDLKETALNDPIGFVKTLNTESSLMKQIPTRQRVYALPEIEWNRYFECVDVDDLEEIRNQKLTRTHTLRQTSKLLNEKQQQQQSGDSPTTSNSRAGSFLKSSRDEENSSSVNYNKSWNVDEQRRLEELLIEFPPEDNEAARFRKIANKLGTRTPLQVQSHCQKYFIKLAKAGLPIPGRMPNLKTYVTKKNSRGARSRGVSHISIGGGRASNIYQGKLLNRLLT
jgi:hypothetical protein